MVVEDHLVKSASNALVEAGFTLCTDIHCRELRYRPRPIGEIHFHIESKYPWHTILSIYNISSTVWWLPSIPLGFPARDDPVFKTTKDPRLPPYTSVYGCSGQLPDLYPIKILSPSAFTEAILFLLCRDLSQDNGFDSWWKTLLSGLLEDKPTPAPVVKKWIRSEFSSFWEVFGRNGLQPSLEVPDPMSLLRELRQRLIESGGLPPSPLAQGTID